ncbi:MAG: FMN-binding protein [Candidatus Cohnella colombiensis]|uniref:FMN-binding protein n=1 Tax=Candidatus Cohnella colombiensis TaxID=3121368 RepID=A0AA95JHW5_9BACL|nr:MAG: FMN-binding protein [Cohnella sp.]
MDKKWVILCSTAVAAVYAAGYFTTETQASIVQPPLYIEENHQSNDVQPNDMPTISSQTNNSQTNNSQTNSSQTNNSQTNNSQTNSSQTNSVEPTTPIIRLYQDGTYTGLGKNRRGSIQVAVTFKNDKITDVEISKFAMHYSKRDVVGLPEEVLQIQSAQVRNVSGATYSTRAFKDAINDAMSQAQNA